MNAIIRFAAAFLFIASVFAAPAAARIDCDGIVLSDRIATFGVNLNVRDERMRLTNRKTLVVHGARAVDADGCDIEVVLNVTIERTRRRDAVGTITISGVLERDGDDLVLSEAHLDDIDVSHLSSLGEAIFRGIANWLIDDVFVL